MSIFSSIKRLIKHSAVYGIGYIITRSLGFLLLPLYTNIFPKNEFGVAGLLSTYIAVFTNLYTYGIDVAFFRFFILGDSEKEKKRVFSTAFFTMLTTSLIFSILIFLNAESLGKLIFSEQARSVSVNITLLIQLSSGILFFDALGLLPFLVYRAEERSVPFIVYKFINVLLTVILNVLFINILKTGVEGMFVANIIASAVTFFILLPLVFSQLSFSYSRTTLKDLFAFGLPYIPSTLSVVLMDSIDRVFIERLIGVDAVGLYNTGAKLGMFMALFVTAFRFAWHPYFLATSKQENAKEIFSKIFTYVILACGVVFLFFSIFINDMARIQIGTFSLIGKEYWDATVVVPVIFLAYIFYAVYLNCLIGIYLYKKTIYLPFITVGGMVCNLLALYFLIPVLGIMGAAWARLIAYIIMAVALYYVGQKLYPVRYEWMRIIKMSAVIALLYGLSSTSFFAAHFLLKVAAFLSLPAVLWLTGFFEKAELQTFRQVLTFNKKTK
jgi:O-antigen/teichoic acid export membrane protein